LFGYSKETAPAEVPKVAASGNATAPPSLPPAAVMPAK
jgi:hypothetical protein